MSVGRRPVWPGSAASALLPRGCCAMAGKEGSEDGYNSMELSEEENGRGSGWEQAVRTNRKRKKEHKGSQRGSDSDKGESEARNPEPEILHVGVRFEGEGGGKQTRATKTH